MYPFISQGQNNWLLTLSCPECQIRHVEPKFRFQLEKGSQKKISYGRRNYESVDDKRSPL